MAVSGVQPPQQPQNLALATSALDAPVINMTSGGGGKNFYQCYFPDCSKTYTTAAGLRYHRKVVVSCLFKPM